MFDDVRNLYSDTILAHGRAPAHAARPDGWQSSARGDNPMCGDRITVFVSRAGDHLAQAGFEARGCELVKASADLMCEAVATLPDAAIRSLAAQVEAMARSGHIPEWDQACPACATLGPLSAVHEYPSRLRCVTLPWTTLVTALDAPQSGETP